MTPHTITVYPWCIACHVKAVLRSGDACGGCMGTLEAMLDPIVHPAVPPRPGRAERFRRWVRRLG